MHRDSIRDPPGTGNGGLTVERRRLQTPAQREVRMWRQYRRLHVPSTQGYTSGQREQL